MKYKKHLQTTALQSHNLDNTKTKAQGFCNANVLNIAICYMTQNIENQ